MIPFDHSLPAMLLSVYGVALVVSVVVMELVSYRQLEGLDFAALLDKLEPFWVQSTVSVDAAELTLGAIRQQRVLSDKETLRRIAGNARILAQLSQVEASQSSPEERTIARRIRRDGMWLGVLAHMLGLVLPVSSRAPGVGLLIECLGASYWSTVSRLKAFYCVHHSRQITAFNTACRFGLASSIF